MIDIKNIKCIRCKKKQPFFNYKSETHALYCSKCKKDNMIDIESPKCITCKKKQPIYNYITESKALYCFACKHDDMIDVKTRKCKGPLCNTSANKK